MKITTLRKGGRPLLFALGVAAFLVSSIGVASALLLVKADTTPSSNPPSISISFPAAGGAYNASSWVRGCSTAGVCGTVSDKDGVARVTVALLSRSTAKYWNGSTFGSSTALYNTATGTSSWRYSKSLPPDGSYVTYVRATDALGNTTPASSPVNASFSIDTVAPAPPAISDSPSPITTLLDAVLNLLHVQSDVRFQCQLDGQSTQSCGPTVTYAHLTIGDHCVRLFAADAALNLSTATTFCWTIVTRSFGLSGNSPGLNYPGLSQPIDVVITNPYLFDITVTSIDVTIQDKTTTSSGAANPACVGNENFRIARVFQGPVDVPARSTRSLSQLGVAVSRWPQLQMINLPRSQDGCKNARFALTYSGIARKHL